MSKLKITTFLTCVLGLAGTAASAQDYWSGAYAGGTLQMFHSIEGPGNRDAHGATPGIHGGYRHNFGSFVLGGEVEANFLGMQMDGLNEMDGYVLPKIAFGYATGPAVTSVVVGYGFYDTNFGDIEGLAYGLSFDYMINQNWSVGIEALHHDFSEHGNPIPAPGFGLGIGVPNPEGEASSVSVRISMNF